MEKIWFDVTRESCFSIFHEWIFPQISMLQILNFNENLKILVYILAAYRTFQHRF